MDNSTFGAYKEKIGTTLTNRLNNAYEQGILSEEETPLVAQFILDNIDKVSSHEELIAFLEELARKWNLFGPILIIEQLENLEKNDHEAASRIGQLMKEDKIDEALKVAEETTNAATENSQTGGDS